MRPARENEIVVGVDGSPESKAALRWAIDEANLRSGGVLALYAWAYPTLGGSFVPAEEPALYEGRLLQTAAEELLDGVVSEIERGGRVQVRRLVVEGDAAEALVDASEDADLLVVGSRGLGGVSGLLLGSVSGRCAREAACPVVIVRGGRARDT